MPTVTLGRTGITTDKNGFGALPVQRVSKEDAAYLLRKAFDGGITFFDTARSYTDSEEKLGYAFEGMRDKLFIATKTPSTTVEGFWKDLETSLRLLKTDYIDIYQFHNPAFCPKPGDGTGLYEAMLEAKAQGKIRFIGLTNHRGPVAREAVESGLYDTLQFPFSYLASEKDEELVHTVHEEADDVARDHLTSLGMVEDGSTHVAEEDGDRGRDDGRQDHAGDADDGPVGDEDQTNLSSHGAKRHAEVESHARHDGDQEGEDEEGVPAQPREDLIEQVAAGVARQGDSDAADDDEKEGNQIVDQQFLW